MTGSTQIVIWCSQQVTRSLAAKPSSKPGRESQAHRELFSLSLSLVFSYIIEWPRASITDAATGTSRAPHSPAQPSLIQHFYPSYHPRYVRSANSFSRQIFSTKTSASVYFPRSSSLSSSSSSNLRHLCLTFLAASSLSVSFSSTFPLFSCRLSRRTLSNSIRNYRAHLPCGPDVAVPKCISTQICMCSFAPTLRDLCLFGAFAARADWISERARGMAKWSKPRKSLGKKMKRKSERIKRNMLGKW